MIFEKLNNFRIDERFSEILTGSVWAFGAQIIATALGLVASIMIARIYGAEMVGILSIIQAVVIIAGIFTVLGTDVSILRLIPEHVAKFSMTSAFKVYSQAQYLVGAVSLCASALLFFSADFIADKVFAKSHLAFYIALAACVVLFRSLTVLNTQAVRGLGLIREFSFMRILPSAAVLFFLCAFTFLHGGPNSPVYSQMLAWGVTAAAGAWIMNRAFRKRIRSDDLVRSLPWRELVRVSSPMMVTASMSFVIGQTGVILLGIFRSEVEVGYYAMALRLASLTTFVLAAVNSMAAPKFAELFHKGKMDELFYVAKKSTRLIFFTTMPILLVLITFGKPILGLLFGQEFSVAYFAMVLLVIGQFVSAIAGSTANFMNMTGNQRKYRNIMLLAGLINLILSAVLIPRYGIIGAAWSGMSCLIFWNLYTLAYIKSRYGQSIGYLPLLGKLL